MGIALAIVLGAFVAAHGALVAGLARGGRTRWRAPLALIVPPLAPWWGYRAGMRLRALAWAAALVLYAFGTFVAAPG
jgi:hypothetical protein